jgi:MSHA pilin protein MshD
MCTRCSGQRGVSLIELIIFIVIVGVGVAGILVSYDTVVRGSADPIIRKQALAIAESLLLEVEQQAFTWCDPQDDNVLTASSAAACKFSTNDQNKGGAAFPTGTPAPSPASETRGNIDDPYDNVADYAGYTAAGSDIVGGNANADYQSSVTITRAGGAAPFADLPPDAVLRIAVTVSGRGESVTLVGYRVRYAPNAPG